MGINREESRTKNSVRNVFFAVILYIAKILTQFAVRAFFVRYFAVQYLGVNGLFTNVLSVLSLAELGIGNAIVYEMYEPIAKKNYEKLYALIELYRKLYFIIAAVISVIGVAIIPFLPHLIKDFTGIKINLIIVYSMYLFQTVVGYFFAYRRSVIFAFQRNDVESLVGALSYVLMGLAQIAIIVSTGSFYAYTLSQIVFTIFEGAMLYKVSFFLLPRRIEKAEKLSKNDANQIKKNIGALFFHKLGSAVVLSTDNIVISAFIGTYILGIYSNYSLVVNALGSFMALFLTALRSSVGNLIADKEADHVYGLFHVMLLAYIFIVGSATVGAGVCFQNFIVLLTDNASYVLSDVTVLIIIIEFYVLYSKNLCGIFKEGAGLFWNDRYRALFEAGINIILDIILVLKFGVNGVLVATIISTLTTVFWIEPYVLFKHYFKRNAMAYFYRYGLYSLLVALSFVLSSVICNMIGGQEPMIFLIKGAVGVSITTIVFGVFTFKTIKKFWYYQKARWRSKGRVK